MRLPRSALLLLSPILGGCGYSTGLSLAPDYESVGVELFGNDSRERSIEREMHTALTRSTRDLVDAQLVPPGRASLVLRGKVLDYRRRGGIRTSGNEQVESGLTIVVEASLWDSRANVALAGPVRMDTRVGYTLDPEDQNEAEARSRALTNLADRIVLDLFTRAQGREPEEGTADP